MRRETALLLAKARGDLRDAEAVAAIGLARIAARCAYCAAFHAAEVLICERTGKVPKTHSGVHSEFARLTRGRDVATPLQGFLTRSYKHKQVSDYGPPESDVPPMEESVAAIPAAIDFVDRVEELLSEAEPTP